MRDTIYCELDEPADSNEIEASIEAMIANVQRYVPGYRLRFPPLVQDRQVTTMIEVEGAGDYLPKYSGNLDIINAASIGIAEHVAIRWIKSQ
jgi:acetaldehyde dehydrogenase (acetylating)